MSSKESPAGWNELFHGASKRGGRGAESQGPHPGDRESGERIYKRHILFFQHDASALPVEYRVSFGDNRPPSCPEWGGRRVPVRKIQALNLVFLTFAHFMDRAREGRSGPGPSGMRRSGAPRRDPGTHHESPFSIPRGWRRWEIRSSGRGWGRSSGGSRGFAPCRGGSFSRTRAPFLPSGAGPADHPGDDTAVPSVHFRHV